MSGAFRMPAFGRRRTGRRSDPRDRRRRALGVAAVIVALLILYAVFTNIWTAKLWYASTGLGSVFSTLLVTRVLMFLVVGLVMAAIITGNVWIAFAARFHPDSAGAGPSPGAQRWAQNAAARPRLAAGVLALVVLVFGGIAGAGMWRTFLAWWHRTPFGVTDPQFGRDVSFYVFDYPWLRALLGLAYSIVLLSLVLAAVTHYLYGGFRPASKGRRAIGPAQVQFSVLLGVLVLLKGFGYWLDRYGQALSQNRNFTGIAYTGDHAVLPSKSILVAICVLAALLFFANIVRRTWLLPITGVIAVVVSSILIGVIWPTALQQLRVHPSEADREAPYIAKNIAATRAAYGIDKVKVSAYKAATTLSPSQLSSDAAVVPGIRLLDPTIVSQTFEQLQQVKAFYAFPKALDVDRYNFGQGTQDTVLAVREVRVGGLPDGQRNWTNEHTVYTHGFGVVAANGNQATSDGGPVFSESELPPVGKMGDYQGRIYYGEQSPSYSIVGGPGGSQPLELDTPSGNGADSDTSDVGSYYTYRGLGGVPLGSLGRQLLYATKFHDLNILLSSRVNADSRIMYDRTPRQRLEKAAPWLTVDGDPYPAVVNGRVKWILDGYTTTQNYPNSERVSLENSTSDSLTTRGGVQQPGQTINYIRNSVKATVDAYDGTVSLYAWDAGDPILKTWMKVFPGLVQPKSSIPAALAAHMRYPEDLFKVQRDLLARYHVTDAKTWYSGNDRWQVPTDPTDASNSLLQPPYYLSLRMPGQSAAAFSLSSSFVPQSNMPTTSDANSGRNNLSAFLAVDADAGSPDYGTFRLLRLPTNSPIFGPGQVANAFQRDQSISSALLPFTRQGAQSRASMGNLLTLPLGGGLLYVQPVYTQANQAQNGSYPSLTYVLVCFANKVAYGSTLSEALGKLFKTSTSSQTGQTGQTGQDDGSSSTTVGNASVVNQELAAAQQSFTTAQAALKKGDLQGYAKAVSEAQQHIAKAQAAAKQLPTTKSTPTPTSPPSSPTSPPPTSTTSPTPG